MFGLEEKDVCGPKHSVTIQSPLEAVKLLLIFTWDIIYSNIKQILIKKEKNDNLKKKVVPVKTFTLAVFHKYLAILLLMGVKKVTTATECWNRKSPHFSPHISKIMGKHRWKHLNSLFTQVYKTKNHYY